MSGLGHLGDMAPHANVDAFAEALDGTAAGLLDDTEMLVMIVDRLHGLPGTVALAGAGPRPEFRSRLREQLLDEAHDLAAGDGVRPVVPLTSRWNESWGRRNRGRLVSGLAAGVVGLTAVSVAAANSLPGSPFYNLKRDSESLRYTLAGSDEARGKLELGFARTRLHEIDRLTAHDAAWGVAPVTTPQAAGATDTTILATSLNTRVVRLFADMDAEATKGSALLARSFQNHPRPGPILAVQQFAKDQAQAIASLAPRLSGPALRSATHSLVWAKAAVTTTAIVLQSCGVSTCSKASLAHLTGALTPPGGPASPAPTVVPSVTPTPTSTQTPSQAAQPPVTVPSVGTSAPTSPQPTQGQQPTSQPTGSQPSPTDTATQPTDSPPVPPPTTTPPTTPTDSPTPTDPTTAPPTDAPTTPAPSTSPTPEPTTAPPPPSTAAPTTPAPPPPSTAPVVTTTPPPPSTTPPLPSAAPTTTTPAASEAPRSTKPPVICLPPFKLVGQICVHPGHGPIHS
jgi:hypothetical protein